MSRPGVARNPVGLFGGKPEGLPAQFGTTHAPPVKAFMSIENLPSQLAPAGVPMELVGPARRNPKGSMHNVPPWKGRPGAVCEVL